ncbi:hypothetical protein TYRP_018120 [Tyrophagus putrescentiae]|nr:hypothetical protein TYRP_018120 [Tyrophagus putrescentiae]
MTYPVSRSVSSLMSLKSVSRRGFESRCRPPTKTPSRMLMTTMPRTFVPPTSPILMFHSWRSVGRRATLGRLQVGGRLGEVVSHLPNQIENRILRGDVPRQRRPVILPRLVAGARRPGVQRQHQKDAQRDGNDRRAGVVHQRPLADLPAQLHVEVAHSRNEATHYEGNGEALQRPQEHLPGELEVHQLTGGPGGRRAADDDAEEDGAEDGGEGSEGEEVLPGELAQALVVGVGGDGRAAVPLSAVGDGRLHNLAVCRTGH